MNNNILTYFLIFRSGPFLYFLKSVTTTTQFMRESFNELRRFSAQCNAEKVRSRWTNATVVTLRMQIDQLLAPTVVFTDDVDKKMSSLLQECLKHCSGLGITNAERITILQAMGSVSGHWYKCPNGHIYYIGDCGGATQLSRCNECGAAIGGGSHRLVSGNAHAPEMDGSAAAAWPPQ